MLYPKQSKYLKSHTILDKSTFVVYNENLCFGSYGLVALHSGYLSPEELEAVRRVAVRAFRGIIRIWNIVNNKKKHFLKLWIRVFAFHSLTKKPNEVRMGKGKGDHFCWVYPVHTGKIILELNIPSIYANKILLEMQSKLSVKCSIIEKKL